MRFTKYNNPSRKRKTSRKMDRTTADIMAAKQMVIDSKLGYDPIVKTYNEISDKFCGKESRQ